MPTANDIELTADEQGMLAGEFGAATALAMRILVRMAPLYGANRLLPVTRAHIDGCIYEGDAGLEFAERLAREGGRVRVPTSLNVISLDRAHWKELGLDPIYAGKARRLGQAYLDMGAVPTFTCTPYQTDARPVFGEQIAWAESNAVAFANSVIGARTNRYGDYLDISCALTGRVPAAGLHLDENRLGQVLLRLPAMPPGLLARDDFYPVLGYLIGSLVDDEIAVIDGLDAKPNEDQLKSLAAATATSGSVALFHLVGITPEAPTLPAAFGGKAPHRVVQLTMADLRAARAELTTAAGDALDVVGFGSPHCSLTECRRLAELMAGRTANPGVEVFITTSRAVKELLARSGHLATLEAFGAKVTADTCIVVSPLVKRDAKVLMTNSAKYAHYGPGLIGVQSVYGSTESCVESAVAGRRRDRGWTMANMIELIGTVIVPGAASGVVLTADEPLSFWGGYEPTTGEIIDRRHPLTGENAAGCVLSIPNGRGSCSASGVFLESIRNGCAPAAIIVSRIDPILGLGSILGDELYDKPVPIVLLSPSDRARIQSGDLVEISDGGRLTVRRG